MTITFNQPVCLNVVTDFDAENEVVEDGEEMFSLGETADGDIVEDKGASVDFQFADGSMVFNLLKEFYDVARED